MIQTKIFKSNKSQAVRLPKAVAFPEAVEEVEVVVEGSKRIISPAGTSWDDWFDNGGVTPDFMTERSQPEQQKRESFDD